MSILFGDKEVIVSTSVATKGVSDKDAPVVAKKGRSRKKKDTGDFMSAPVEPKEEG